MMSSQTISARAKNPSALETPVSIHSAGIGASLTGKPCSLRPAMT